MSRGASARDRKMLLILCGVMLVMIVGVSMLAPQSAENDPRPTIDQQWTEGSEGGLSDAWSAGDEDFAVGTARWRS